MNRIFGTATCPTCGRVGGGDRDEEGVPEMETWPCQGSDSCTNRLCEGCRVKCDGCGLYACAEHIALNSDDWLFYCDICRKDMEQPEDTRTPYAIGCERCPTRE